MKHFPEMMLRSAEMGEWHDRLNLPRCYTIMINSKLESTPKAARGTNDELGHTTRTLEVCENYIR